MQPEILEKLRETRKTVPPVVEYKHSALIVIDMQIYQVRESAISKSYGMIAPEIPAYYLAAVEETIEPNVGRLLDAFREHKATVVFTKFVTKDTDSSDLPPYLREANKFAVEAFGGPIIPQDGVPSTEIIDSLRPIEGELIVKKSGSSAFTNTNLHTLLKSRSVKQIVLVGVFTNFCVENTARSGFDLGYEVVIAEDACAAPLPQLHDNSVAAMEMLFAAIAKTEKLIGEHA